MDENKWGFTGVPISGLISPYLELVGAHLVVSLTKEKKGKQEILKSKIDPTKRVVDTCEPWKKPLLLSIILVG